MEEQQQVVIATRGAMGPGRPAPGNMLVPIDLLKPILPDLPDNGHCAGPLWWSGTVGDTIKLSVVSGAEFRETFGVVHRPL